MASSQASAPGPVSGRPLSPHLQIYKPQWTSVLSIGHRVAGVALAAGSLLILVWLWGIVGGSERFDWVQGWLASPIGRVLLFGWSAALFYHLCNGIRHLVWDAGYGFELKTAEATAWLTVLATLALTLAAWVAGYHQWGKL